MLVTMGGCDRELGCRAVSKVVADPELEELLEEGRLDWYKDLEGGLEEDKLG